MNLGVPPSSSPLDPAHANHQHSGGITPQHHGMKGLCKHNSGAMSPHPPQGPPASPHTFLQPRTPDGHIHRGVFQGRSEAGTKHPSILPSIFHHGQIEAALRSWSRHPNPDTPMPLELPLFRPALPCRFKSRP